MCYKIHWVVYSNKRNKTKRWKTESTTCKTKTNQANKSKTKKKNKQTNTHKKQQQTNKKKQKKNKQTNKKTTKYLETDKTKVKIDGEAYSVLLCTKNHISINF